MKKLIFVISISLIANSIIAQWHWQNPYPQGYDLNDVQFLDPQTGWAVGVYGTIITTTDGGDTWDIINSEIADNLNKIYFTDYSTGWVVGDSGCIFHSDDGGESWSLQPSGTSFDLVDVHFIDNNQGWTIGCGDWDPYFFYYRSCVILSTNNGGASWASVLYDTTYTLKGVHFISNSHGWAVGTKCDTAFRYFEGIIISTYNGGISWANITNPNFWLGGFEDIIFVDSDNGWVVGSSNIFHTDDSGFTWEVQFTHGGPGGGGPYLYSISFADTNHGCAVGLQGMEGVGNVPTYRFTDNGGEAWLGSALYFPNLVYNGISLSSPDHGWTVGSIGIILHTSDGCNTWQSQSGVNTFLPLYDIFFTDQDNGWAVGFHATLPSLGIIMHTTDGGHNWMYELWLEGPSGIFFTDNNNGWMIGSGYESSFIKNTSNGGETWIDQLICGDEYLNDVFFIDSNFGWIVGPGGTIIHTGDGGTNWEYKDAGTDKILEGVFFTDINHGWIAGWEGTIHNTTNGGDSWQVQYSGITDDLMDIYFADSYKGWAIGWNGLILNTSDGGSTWVVQFLDTSIYLTRMTFTDLNKGWIVGEKANGDGLILYTIDGGNSWEEQHIGLHRSLTSVCFTDANNGWIAGEKGTIMHIDNGSTVDINKYSESNNALKLFPNPTNERIIVSLLPTPSCNLSYAEVILLHAKKNKKQ